MALNSLLCADEPLRNYSHLTYYLLTERSLELERGHISIVVW